MTLARPTSEPVPAVVGTAITGAMPTGSALVHQSPTSSKSQSGRVWPAMKAMVLPASSAEPPPNATTPSWPPAFSTASPAETFDSTGLGLMALNSAAPRPARVRLSNAAIVMAWLARNGSVTISGRLMPALAQALASSPMRPAPKRTEVG
jgi:hypothetical protein